MRFFVHAAMFSIVSAPAKITIFSDDSVSLRVMRIGLGSFFWFVMGTRI